jgi:hypothetical protein
MTPSSPKVRFASFESVLNSIHLERLTAWSDIEVPFLNAIQEFDSVFAEGKKPKGWYQAKARYFNDTLAALISTAAGQSISARAKKRSILFDKIDIDLCFPSDGPPIVAGEAKALGTPPHHGNKHKARESKSDLHKRVREVALTSMDLKAAHTAPRRINSFQDWVATATPAYVCFWALRVDNPRDLDRCRSILYSLRNYCDQVGAFIYEPTQSPTTYGLRHFREVSMDRAINEFVQRTVSGS